jgi:DNA-binding IclR family transcriptional regulator
MCLTDIAKSSGLPLSNTRFYLVSLSRVGLVKQTSHGRYQLGPAALRLGLAALAQSDVIEIARGHLAELGERTGETVFLSVWSDLGPVVVNRVDGERLAPLGVRVGSIVPLIKSATGKVFLTCLPPSATRTLLRREVRLLREELRSATPEAELERITCEVRAHGMARNKNTMLTGVIGMAAPVFDYEGSIRCVITLMGHEEAIDMSYGGEAARALLATADEVSRAAGFKPDGLKRDTAKAA